MPQTLILIPGQEARGGVTTYFNSLRKHFTNEVSFLERGCRSFPYRKGLMQDLLRLVKDYANFVKTVRRNKEIALIHINTSFDKRGFYRDAIYVLLATLLRKKKIVFYHGWDEVFAAKKLRGFSICKKLLFLADASIVLSERFRNDLIKGGYTKKVYAETTTVDVDLLSGMSEEHIQNRITSETDKINILFLARIEREKGIYITLEAFKKVQQQIPQAHLTIVGDGQELEKIKSVIKNEQISNVSVEGFIRGNDRAKYFRSSSLYILPTTYKEGMPTSILEAFAFGIPVITRPVAGIMDVMQHEENGYLVESTNPEDYASTIKALLTDTQKRKAISIYNYQHAEKFYSSSVCNRITDIYNNHAQ